MAANRERRHTRRDFLAAAGWTAAALAFSLARPAGATPGGAARNRRPNFLFLFADDLGWGDLGCYGHPLIQTPNLDRLASEGILFTQAYMAGSVCSPSRAAILTGLFPARTGIHGHLDSQELNERRGMPNHLDPAFPTVARSLQAAGYATGFVGKWHLGHHRDAPEIREYGFDQQSCFHGPSPRFLASDPDYREKASEWFADAALEFLDAHRERNFFLNVSFVHPHATAIDPSEEQMAVYAHRMPHRVRHKYPGAQAVYYAVVTELDRQIGRILDRLDALGLADNTVVFFSSDNGPEDVSVVNATHAGVGSPGPFRGRKRSLYEGGIRVPFLVRWPGVAPAGQVNRSTVFSGVDVFPTLCRLAGAEWPARLDGEDLSAAWAGDPVRRTRPLMWEWRFRIVGHTWHRSPMLAVREGDWKLLCNPEGDRVELYNIPADPMELNNLAEDRPDIAGRLRAQALAWRRELPEGPADSGAGSDRYPWP